MRAGPGHPPARPAAAGQAATLDSLGYAHLRLGDHAQAIDYLERALALIKESVDLPVQAVTLTHLGDAHGAAGDAAAARSAWQEALSILDDLNIPDTEDLRARLGPPADRSTA